MALSGNGSIDRMGAVFGDGLGTRIDDLREAAAIRSVLGDATVPFTAATPAMGYTGAAGGVFNLVHAALSLRRGVVPGLANCDDPDPECPVHFTPTPAPMDGDRALVWNSDRGVKNVAVVAGTVPE
jgi:3-oxoacyl-(acyl-carrier-protein) synthase